MPEYVVYQRSLVARDEPSAEAAEARVRASAEALGHDVLELRAVRRLTEPFECSVCRGESSTGLEVDRNSYCGSCWPDVRAEVGIPIDID